jgi:hypothetical protein
MELRTIIEEVCSDIMSVSYPFYAGFERPMGCDSIRKEIARNSGR